MKKVFIGGSRRISKLNDQIRSKLAEIVDRELEILIGDANGADRALQAQLAGWKYPRVSVYFVGAKPRNNVGCWPLLHVDTPKGVKGFDFFAAKDKRMAHEADCGLMLWDGESRGTLANVVNLVSEEKPVAVYVSQRRRFLNARTPADIETLNAFGVPQESHVLQSRLPLDVPHKTTRKRRRRTA